jgi:hypothetical protein
VVEVPADVVVRAAVVVVELVAPVWGVGELLQAERARATGTSAAHTARRRVTV